MAENIEKKFLGTAGVQQLIANTRSEIATAEQAAKNYADSLADNYDAAGTAQTKVDALANGQVKTNTEHIGTMDDLETASKGDLVTAINEVRNAVSAGGTAAAMTMTEQTTGLGEGIAKAYVLKQGENTVGTINIPKDMVVQSGSVVTNPEGQAAGTYIKLVLANATNDEIFVNVGNLVDIYTAKASAAQVQLAIDSSSREISASIVAGSVTATELAANAVVTAKIADGNVTKAKLSTEVQASLDKADAAAQDATDKAAQALADAKAYADSKVDGVDLSGIATNASDIDKLEASLATGGATANAIAEAKQAGTDASAHADELNNAMDNRVKALEAIDHDHSNKTQLDSYDKTQAELLAAAKSEAENYTNQQLGPISQSIETNTTNIGAMDELGTDEKGSLVDAINELNDAAHNHANKTQLDSYDKTQTELLAAAASAAATDSANKDAVVLSEAQGYTDAAISSFVEITAADINALFAAE